MKAKAVYEEISLPLLYQFPKGFKLLFTAVLLVIGIGYAFALAQVYEVQAGRDGKFGLSVKDLQIAYSGDKSGSRLESALKGPMQGMLPEKDRMQIITWIHAGKKDDDFESRIKPIIDNNCLVCHGGTNPNLPNLSDKKTIDDLSKTDSGISVFNLIRVSHIHLFGLTFIFFTLGIIFGFTYTKFIKVKYFMILIPFISIIIDIASWWLSKASEVFAFSAYFGGVLMAISFAYQWIASIYQLWFFRCKDGVCPVK